MPPIPVRQLFIGGEWREPVRGNRLPIINPATEQTIGDIPAATAEDIHIAVKAARKAFLHEWSSATGAHRAKYLRAIAAKVTERKSELARFEALDYGMPLDEAAWNIDDVAACFEYYAGIAEALDAQKGPVARTPDTVKCPISKEPLGVVGLITPWNYPMLMATWKVAPALAAGCTAILKPSELASVTCLELGDICKQVGLPPGVLNILTGLGPEAGSSLVSHPDVDKIAFTGSSATWSKVKTAADVKPVTFELGGKRSILVFEDVDLDQAAEWTLFGCFGTHGQMFSAASRLLVHESIADELLGKLKNWCNIKVSEPFEKCCRLGPFVSQGQYEKVMKFISTAKEEGATILCGGSRPEYLKEMKKGFFIEPAIITNVTTNMQIWREEVFGPVLCVKTFSTEIEAIELANDTDYLFGGAVFSQDLDRCKRVSKKCGNLSVNYCDPCLFQAPQGRKKHSGIRRELGEWGMDNYLKLNYVAR